MVILTSYEPMAFWYGTVLLKSVHDNLTYGIAPEKMERCARTMRLLRMHLTDNLASIPITDGDSASQASTAVVMGVGREYLDRHKYFGRAKGTWDDDSNVLGMVSRL